MRFMKYAIIVLLILIFIDLVSCHGQTNIINIYNSQVTINNILVTNNTPSKCIVQTNVIEPKKMVVIPPEWIERLQWENMLNERRNAAFSSYLRRYNR